ncbi:MAG: PorV/PorQ family protein [Bacteroidales bacterium]|nr:PorV/PorQ family protein [Bacteroidales bacterium]
MKRLVICILAGLAAVGAARAQSAPALLVPGDARTLSLGMTKAPPGSFETVRTAVTGGLWAPGSASNTYLGADVALKLSPGFTLFVDGRYFRDKPYDITNAQGSVSGTYTPADMFFSLGGSFNVSEALALRLDGRVISSSIAPSAKATGFCGDLSAIYGGDGFQASLAVRNLGPGLDYGGGSNPLPSLVSLAGAYSPMAALTLNLEADYLFSGALMAGLGVEYGIADIAFLRAGFHYGDAAKALPSYVSLGLGLEFTGITFDLAYLTASETLGNTVMVGLGYSF